MPEISVTIYSTGPSCMQCRLTKRLLDDLAIAYREIDLTDPANNAALEYITEDLGCSRAPVVSVNGEPENYWSGFNPDKIKSLAVSDHKILLNRRAWHSPTRVQLPISPIGSAQHGPNR